MSTRLLEDLSQGSASAWRTVDTRAQSPPPPPRRAARPSAQQPSTQQQQSAAQQQQFAAQQQQSAAQPSSTRPRPAPPASDALESHLYEVDDYEKSGAGLHRVQISPIFEQFTSGDVEAVDALRPPYMPRLPEADLRATMTQEAHLQQVRELILADPRVRFVNHVADLTNTRLGASTSDLAAAVGLTLDRPGGGALLAPGASQAPSPVQVALGRTPSQRLGASTPARSIAGSEGAASISRAASIFGGAGGAGQPAMLQRTQKISEMEPIDMATLGISDDELRALGESALRSEQLRSAAAYVKRPEATGLILIDTKINSHAETVFNELRALRNSPLRLQSDMLTLVYSEDLWRLFAEAVAARINMTNGGLAPQRDVLQAQFKRVSAHYASLYTELANDIGYDTQGRIVSRKLQRRRNGGGGGGSSWGGGGGGGGSGSWELGGGSRGGGGGAAPSFGSQAEMHDWLYQAPPLPRSSLGPSFAR